MKNINYIVIFILTAIIIILSSFLTHSTNRVIKMESRSAIEQNSFLQLSSYIMKTFENNEYIIADSTFNFSDIHLLNADDTANYHHGSEFIVFYYGINACLSCVDKVYSGLLQRRDDSLDTINKILIVNSSEEIASLAQRERLFGHLCSFAYTNGNSYIDKLLLNDMGFFKINSSLEIRSIIQFDDIDLVKEIIKRDYKILIN